MNVLSSPAPPKVLIQEAWDGPRNLHTNTVPGFDADDL